MLSSTNYAKPTLLSLPLEIRMMIWKFSQSTDKELEIRLCCCQLRPKDCPAFAHCSRTWPEPVTDLPSCPTLLLVNHQTKTESAPVTRLRRTVVACGDGCLSVILKQMPVTTKKFIKSVRIVLLGFNMHEISEEDHKASMRDDWESTVGDALRSHFVRLGPLEDKFGHENFQWTYRMEMNVDEPRQVVLQQDVKYEAWFDW